MNIFVFVLTGVAIVAYIVALIALAFNRQEINKALAANKLALKAFTAFEEKQLLREQKKYDDKRV